MAVAQQLYEGVDLPGEGSVGLITYMRTDSPALSQSAQDDIAALVAERYGRNYVKRTQYKAKAKQAQEAHEGIRPTAVARTPEVVAAHLDPSQRRLYELIWKRAVASQMAQALYDQTSVDIKAGELTFRATGSVLRFDGFVRVYLEGRDDDVEEEAGTLPELVVGQVLRLVELTPEQHFTEPPPRYSEASLVKALEEHGIGRPSTYSPTISTLMDRKYVRLDRKRFHPEDVGIVVTDLLADVFPKVIDLGFTAEMEEDLDRIASGAKRGSRSSRPSSRRSRAPSPSARRRSPGPRRRPTRSAPPAARRPGPSWSASGAGTAGSCPAAATRTASTGATPTSRPSRPPSRPSPS